MQTALDSAENLASASTPKPKKNLLRAKHPSSDRKGGSGEGPQREGQIREEESAIRLCNLSCDEVLAIRSRQGCRSWDRRRMLGAGFTVTMYRQSRVQPGYNFASPPPEHAGAGLCTSPDSPPLRAHVLKCLRCLAEI